MMENKTIYIVYRGNERLEINSLRVVLVCDDRELIQELLKHHSESWGEPLTKDDLNNLEVLNQTQGRETNYLIEEETLNDFATYAYV